MIPLVHLDEAKQLLVIKFNDDDARLKTLIQAASNALRRYLKTRAADFIDDDALGVSPITQEIFEEAVDATVRVAVIMLTGILYRDPDGVDSEAFYEAGAMPKPIVSLLAGMRTPTLA